MTDESKPQIRKPPVLFRETQAVIARIEKVIEGPFIGYWNSDSGSVCENDVVGLYGLLRKLGRQSALTLFIKSDGGSGQSALRMVNLLRQFSEQLTAVVPLECKSAATMLALGADRILMGPLAHLSAIDTSLTHDLSPLDRDNDRVSVSHDELLRVIKLWRAESKGKDSNPYESLYPHVHPLVVGAVHRASSLSVKLCTEILSYHMSDRRKASQIANRLNSEYPSHGYPITLREAKRIGLKAQPMPSELNELLIELHEVYSVMGQRATTDFDALNQHDHSIVNIIEGAAFQMFFQRDKDWYYRQEERRWVPLNDRSAWYKSELVRGEVVTSEYHIR
jgi:hypothetical protein